MVSFQQHGAVGCRATTAALESMHGRGGYHVRRCIGPLVYRKVFPCRIAEACAATGNESSRGFGRRTTDGRLAGSRNEEKCAPETGVVRRAYWRHGEVARLCGR